MYGSKCALSAFTKQTWVHALSCPANCRLQRADTQCYVRTAGLLKLAGAGKKTFSKHLQMVLLRKSWSHLFFFFFFLNVSFEYFTVCVCTATDSHGLEN